MKLASFYYFYGNTKYFFDFQEKSFNCIPTFCVIPYRTVSQFFCFFCRECGGLLYFSTNLHHIHNLQVQFFIFKPSINSSKTWYHYDYLLIIKSLLELFINRCINFRCKTTSTFWLRRTPRTIPTFATISSIKLPRPFGCLVGYAALRVLIRPSNLEFLYNIIPLNPIKNSNHKTATPYNITPT